MMLPRQILVPIDFSEYSEQALDYAVLLAGKLDAKLNLLSVVAVPSLGGVPELGLSVTASMMDELVKNTQAALDKIADARRAQGSIAQVLVRTGDARELIVHTAEQISADMIIMGTHGRRGVKRALLGSVAESVVRWAPCPVLTIRGHKHN